MKRRTFLGVSGATAITSATSTSLGTQPDSSGKRSLARRPNMVLFMPDELRADALACYGNPITRTPNFDRLAAEGTRFANCHVQYPVCGASRCSMLTGWPASVRGHRSLYYFLRPEEPNLFRYLKQSGYDVYWFGKNDALAAQTFYSSVTEWSGGSAMEFGSARTESLTPGIASMLQTPGGDRRGTSDYRLVQSAMSVIERKEHERPFCIFLPMSQPHPPYTAPADFYRQYSAGALPPLLPPGLPKKPSYHNAIRRYAGLDQLRPEQFRQVRAVYYGQVSYSDWLLGEILASLEKSGRNNDTAVMLLSDHGDYAGDYGLVEKWPSALEDCLTHVPLIMKVPGGNKAHTVAEMVELYDVMATSLNLAATSSEHTHFARDLSHELLGGVGDPNRAAFAEGGYNVYEPQCFEPLSAGFGDYAAKIKLQNEKPETISRSAMVRTTTHKLIWRPQGQSELYDLITDPGETRNIIDERASSSDQAALQTQLLEHFINTTGIAPFDKDSRLSPPFYSTPADLTPAQWQRQILDKP